MFGVPRPVLYAVAGVLVFMWATGTQAGGLLGGTAPCEFQVNADVLNVRAGPATGEKQVDSLLNGAKVRGTPTVVNGFRDLGGGRWAADEFLTRKPGSKCEP
ncbi:hypothetical protein A8924_6986 [Saccharopolyspora erythraea NRRL 2338]|uniref:SH3 domain-containing protein n=1 Tax=Saccharopolyspora erythraea TaxID=1836 RepID=A0ABP3P6F5_SACER|nr:hypothetical protein [Saccharopolyspora erythraea]EQD83458.1 hypothetical protein N599_25240 [Saccharopolyspora erythraea D]PFG99441.1 hypothetical protein A8924_6986 [Saccharopolyspora erythraea NRRL 2338]QRK89351.1 SH3 domain-containing protein [Saccharopolyspora erythraea]